MSSSKPRFLCKKASSSAGSRPTSMGSVRMTPSMAVVMDCLSSKCNSKKTDTSSAGMPPILPFAMLRSSVVFPALLCPSSPYLLPGCRKMCVLCSSTLPPQTREK